MPSHNAILKNLDRARKVSLCSDFKRARLGCVVVIGSKVVSVGYNQLKTSPVQKEYNKYRTYRQEHIPDHIHNDTLHAEIDALNKCSYLDYDWKTAEIYIGREDRAGNSKLAKPCPACLEAIKQRGIKRIFYTTEDGYGFLGVE